MAHGWLVARTKGCSPARSLARSGSLSVASLLAISRGDMYMRRKRSGQERTNTKEGRKEGRKGLGFPVAQWKSEILSPDEVKMIFS